MRKSVKEIKSEKYYPAHITSVFLKYRENPQKSLLHLDDESTKIFLPKRELYDKEKEKEVKNKEILTNTPRIDFMDLDFMDLINLINFICHYFLSYFCICLYLF